MAEHTLFVLGASHRTAPLALREQLAHLLDEQSQTELVAAANLRESLWIATCNRVEIYGVSDEPSRSISTLEQRFASLGATPTNNLYRKEQIGAAHHAFRVASSLDSLVVGEPQILGQLKAAFGVAKRREWIGPLLGRCFNQAFALAKRVRSSTGISAGSVSVSSVACDLASRIFSDLQDRNVLLIGAGKMSEAALRKLSKTGAKIRVANRSEERGQALARALGATFCPFEELTHALIKADVVLSSTSSTEFLLTKEQLQPVVRARRYRPLCLIDIAVPRDLDPHIAELDNVFLFDVDDLQQVAAENLKQRQKEADLAEEMVSAAVEDFRRWVRNLALTPTIVSLRSQFHSVVNEELQRFAATSFERGKPSPEEVDRVAQAVVNKLLHQPLTELKRAGDDPTLIQAAQRLFRLNAGEKP